MSVGKFPNLRLLHVFITVAKYQGYANAQQELNLTVSAISNYMSELEEKLGIILCRRGRGGFSLTEKGETVLQQSIDLLNSLEDFERNTASLRGEQTGIFNLGVIDSTITDPMLPMSDIIATFSERFPRVQINLQVRSPNALLQGVLNNELDLAVGDLLTSGQQRDFSSALSRAKTGSTAVISTRSLPFKHLTEALISPMRMVTRSYWSSSDLGRKGFKQSEASAESMEAQLMLILSGKYIGYLPEHYALPWVQAQKLRALLPTEYGYQAPFSLIFRRGRSKETLIRAMRDTIRTRAKGRKG